MVLEYIKVKIYSLAEESKYIRKQEHKHKARAKYLRDQLAYDRRVAWHTKEIKRLGKAKTDQTSVLTKQWSEQNADLAERIQAHELEIKRLNRLHNIDVDKWDGIGHNEFIQNGLYLHRVGIVRDESRAACLAYGFLRGHAYRDLEAKTKQEPDWKRVADLVYKYGYEPGVLYDAEISRKRIERLFTWIADGKVDTWTLSMLVHYVNRQPWFTVKFDSNNPNKSYATSELTMA